MGNLGGSNNLGMNHYDKYYNEQWNNNNKTHENRPNQGGMSMFNSHQNINCTPKEVLNTRAGQVDRRVSMVPTPQIIGENSRVAQAFTYENKNTKMNEPSLIDAFRNNPYTQPLNSVA